MIYQWRAGFRAPVKAADAVPRLLALRKRHGHLAPSAAVADGRPKNSLLHPCFLWDDALAADEHRLQQARELLGACVMIREDAAEDDEPMRCFVSVDRGEDETDYTPVQVLIREMASDPETRQQMLDRAIRAAQTLKRQYGHLLPELSELFEVIARLEQGATV